MKTHATNGACFCTTTESKNFLGLLKDVYFVQYCVLIEVFQIAIAGNFTFKTLILVPDA